MTLACFTLTTLKKANTTKEKVVFNFSFSFKPSAIMPKSWSLGRSSSQKLQAGKEDESHVKRPGFKISRPRPSSMVSIEFPSSPSISHDGEREKNDHVRQKNGSRPNSLYEHEQHSGSALNLLSVTQQRDQALRERKDSAASSTSSLTEPGTNGDSASSKHTNPPTPSRRHISTASTLPSLMKSPSRSSALSSTSTDTSYISASPRPSGKSKKQENGSIKAQDFANGQKSETSQNTKRTLKDVTNQSNDSLSHEVKQTGRKDQQTKTKSKNAQNLTTAMDSLYQLRGSQTKNASRSSIDKSLGSTQHASLVVTSPTLGQGENEAQPISRPDKHEYPYLVRSINKGKTNRQDNYPSRYRTRSKDTNAKQSTSLARYELLYNSGRYLSLSLSQDRPLDTPHQYQYGLLGVPIPTYFATDRLTAWAVERASRIASSFIYLFGS